MLISIYIIAQEIFIRNMRKGEIIICRSGQIRITEKVITSFQVDHHFSPKINLVITQDIAEGKHSHPLCTKYIIEGCVTIDQIQCKSRFICFGDIAIFR